MPVGRRKQEKGSTEQASWWIGRLRPSPALLASGTIPGCRIMTLAKPLLMESGCSLPAEIVRRVRCGLAVPKEKRRLVNCSYRYEKNTKRYKWRNSGNSPKLFKNSMPCEQGWRRRMHKACAAATCGERGILDSRKHGSSTFLPPLLLPSYEPSSD